MINYIWIVSFLSNPNTVIIIKEKTMNMINRVIRAAMLDVQFFNEVERDTSLNTEALLVVIIVSIAGGIGAFVGGLFNGEVLAALGALLTTVLGGVAGYYIWAYVTYFIGTNLFEGRADPGELLRVLGYASGPRILSVLGFIPCVGAMFSLVGAIWSLIAGFIGVREALDLDTGKTLVTVIIGWIVLVVISVVIGLIFGVGFMGLGAASSFLGR
jgi:hypothetical protein